MNSQQLQRPILTSRQANARRWQWLGLGLIGIVAALAIYFYAASVGAPQAQLAQPLLAQSAAIDPAVQGVNGYLKAHANVGQTAAIDPAVQGVNGYLHAHASVGQTAAIDPAVQGVNGYLNAHRAVGQPAQAPQMLPQSVP
jgi:O-antigen/teichoic acid export membrane protein